MSKQVAGIDLPELSSLYEADEDLLKKIDIKTVEGATFKDKVLTILEKIIDYNKNIIKNKDKSYRFFYYVRLAEGSLLMPFYEDLSNDKTSLIVGLHGEALKKDYLYEMFSLDTIVGIGSNHFKPDDSIEPVQIAQYTQNKKALYDEVKEMQLKWANSTRDCISVTIEKFAKDLKIINEMQNMNYSDFFKAKRSYTRQFLIYLRNKIQNKQFEDPQLTPEEIIEIFEYYKNQFPNYEDYSNV